MAPPPASGSLPCQRCLYGVKEHPEQVECAFAAGRKCAHCRAVYHKCLSVCCVGRCRILRESFPLMTSQVLDDVISRSAARCLVAAICCGSVMVVYNPIREFRSVLRHSAGILSCYGQRVRFGLAKTQISKAIQSNEDIPTCRENTSGWAT